MATDPYAAFADPAPSASAATSAPAADPYAAFADPAPASAYDASLFQQRVGRAPSAPELANFQATKGVGWAGDPGAAAGANTSDTTVGQRATGIGESALALGTGALAAVPAGARFIAGLTSAAMGDGSTVQDARDAAQGIQDYWTYKPRTQAGQDITQGVGEMVTSPVRTLVGQPLQAIDKTYGTKLAPAAGQLGSDVMTAAGAVPLLGLEAGAERAAAGASRGARVVSDAVRNPKIPEGTQFDSAGNTITPRLNTTAPSVSTTGVTGDDYNTPGASAATPPTFEKTTSPTAAAAPGASSTLPPEAQAQRKATLNAIGLNDKDIRKSAVEGDLQGAADDHVHAGIKNEGGHEMKTAFDAEKNALNNYAGGIVGDAGGTDGLDQGSVLTRGQTILQPFKTLNDQFETAQTDAYKAAEARAAGKPSVQPAAFQDLLSQDEHFARPEANTLRTGVQAVMRRMGIKGDGSTVLPMTVDQAEELRQYMGSPAVYDPRIANISAQLKDALTLDVARAAGEDIFNSARAVTSTWKQTLGHRAPAGVQRLMNTHVAGDGTFLNEENAPSLMQRMTVGEFNDTTTALEKMQRDYPNNTALVSQAKAALGEIRSQFALKLREAGTGSPGQNPSPEWRNGMVSQYLNANNAKLARVFSPAELDRMETLNRAGNILAVDRRYKGAAVQALNLAQRGTIMAVKHGPAAVGVHLAGPAGGIAGEVISGPVADRLLKSFTKKAARQRFARP